MKKRKFTAVLVLVSLLVTMFPVVQKKPETALAANQVYIEGLGVLTVLHENPNDGYIISLDENKNLVVKGKYYTNSSATLSYHTTRLFFANRASDNYNPGYLSPSECRSVDVTQHTSHPSDDPDYVTDAYTVPRVELENIITSLFPGGKNALKSPQKVYISEGFQLKRRDSSSDPTWDVYGEVFKSLADVRNAGKGKWEWSPTTYANFANYYDIEITLNLVKHNVTVNANPPAGGIVQHDADGGQAYGNDPVTVSATANEGYTFAGWTVNSGGAVLADAKSGTTSFTMPNADVVLTANFKPKATPTPTPKVTGVPLPTTTPKPTPTPRPPRYEKAPQVIIQPAAPIPVPSLPTYSDVHEDVCYTGTKHVHNNCSYPIYHSHTSSCYHTHSRSCYVECGAGTIEVYQSYVSSVTCSYCGETCSATYSYYNCVCSSCGAYYGRNSAQTGMFPCPSCGTSIFGYEGGGTASLRSWCKAEILNCGYYDNGPICGKTSSYIDYYGDCGKVEGYYYDSYGYQCSPLCDQIVMDLTPVYPKQTIPIGATPDLSAYATFMSSPGKHKDYPVKTVTCTLSGFNPSLHNQWQTVTLSYGTYAGSVANRKATTTTMQVYVAGSITVSFDANGGSCTTKSKAVEFGKTYGTLPTPTRPDYVFWGWVYNNAHIKEDSLVTTPADHTLTAAWTPLTQVVTFDANGGTVSPASKTVTYGKTYGTLPTPTRTGYIFDGWWYGDQRITAGTVVNGYDNHTLVADWLPGEYKITLDANGGTCRITTVNVLYAAAYNNTISAECTRTGYIFQGWGTAKTGGETVYDRNGKWVSGTYWKNGIWSYPGNVTLYALWEEGTNTIRYAPNGGTGLMTQDEFKVSVPTAVLKENAFSRKGYEFAGWNTKADGTGTAYADKASIAIPLGTTTLYAQWKAITYTVKIAEDDIRVTPSYSKTYTLSLDQTMTVPAAKSDKSYTITYHLNYQPSMGAQPAWKTAITADNTKASLAFYGWRLYEVTAEGYKYLDHYEPGEVIKNLTSTKNATLILFPYWGGSASYVKLPEVDCVGYDLVGFTTGQAYAPDSFDTEDALRAAIESNILIMAPNGSGAQYQPKESETLYAYYQAKSFIVELDGRGATEHTQTTVTMTYDEIGPDVIPPEKTGYTFHGYYTGVKGTGKQYFDATGTGTAVWREKKTDVLYAYWTQDPVIIPGQDTEQYPEVPQTEQLQIEAALDASTVHIYADDNNPSTDALTDKQPYQVSDIIIGGEKVVEGAIPSTENVALRAKMGTWMFSGTLERVSGMEYVRMHVTVPYRTQYEDAEDETLIISERQTQTIDVLVPKVWTYWMLQEGGLYFPEKVTVENAALEAGKVEVPVTWDSTGAVCRPDYRLTVYGGKGAHVTWSAYDSDDVPSLSIVLTEEEYIISDTPGVVPDVTEHLTNVCHNAAWQDTTQFTVKSDHISVAGLTVLSDAEQTTGAGKVPDLSAVALLEDKIEETSYIQTYESGIPLLTTAKNGRHETVASIVYRADEANIGTITELVIPAVSANEINVHTPVVCIPGIEAFHEDMYQCAEVPEECTVLVLDETGEHSDFVLRIGNEGYHSEMPGYGEKDYGSFLARRDGTVRNEVCFPFDVWIDMGNDKDRGNDVRLNSGEWYVQGDNIQRFYLPVETGEGVHKILFRSVAVNGTGEEEHAEETRNRQIENYVATGTIAVYVTGRLYDFEVYEAGGTIPWDEITQTVCFSIGKRGPEYSEWDTLPLRTGVHPVYHNRGGLAMGGYLYFRVKSIGKSFDEDAVCTVIPYLTVVTENGYEEADIYYEEETEKGIFLKKWEADKVAGRLFPGSESTAGMREWYGSFLLPEALYIAEKDTKVLEYQGLYGLSFAEEFWQTDVKVMLRFGLRIVNTQGEQLYYGRIPDEIVNNIWKKEAEDDYRYDNKGNRYEIQGGEVAVIYPGDDAGNGYGANGIY